MVPDPDAALERVRALADDVLLNDGVRPVTAVELAEAVRGLDRWLSNGGYRPKQWWGCGPAGVG